MSVSGTNIQVGPEHSRTNWSWWGLIKTWYFLEMQRKMRKQRDTSFSCSRRFFVFIVFQGATQLTKYRASPQTCLSLCKRWESCPQLYRGFYHWAITKFSRVVWCTILLARHLFHDIDIHQYDPTCPEEVTNSHYSKVCAKNYNNLTHYCNQQLKWILSKQLLINYIDLFFTTICNVEKKE